MLFTERKRLLKEALERETGFTFEDLKNRNRRSDISDARHLYCFFASRHLREHLKDIGNELGGRDHTTVIHGRNKIKDLLDANDPISDMAKRIEKAIEVYPKKDYTMKELYAIVGHDFEIVG